ncbi:unnamed protein product [Cuscuta campestris]|uniref:Uncharacterized protein n=1 Tax=Cuscuta campestris TaxID=132261 RepID=A0A484K300_9ASTE|nr:unnamed protein product [Cuscuta campestris]
MVLRSCFYQIGQSGRDILHIRVCIFILTQTLQCFCDAKSKFIVTCKSDFLTIDLFPALRCSRAQLCGAKSSSSWRLPSNSTSRPPNT